MTSGETNRFSIDRADWLAIAAVVGFGLVARGIFVLALPPLLHLDSDSYFEITQRLWNGEGFGDLSRRAPLYPLFLWLAARSGVAGLLPAVLMQHLLGVATVVLLYLLARRLLPIRMRPVAVITGLVLAVIPYPILIEQSVLSESLFLFLLAAAAYLLLAWRQEERPRSAVFCGALLAAAALTRPVAVGIFPLWAAMLILLDRKRGWKRTAGFLLRAGLAWAVLLLPLLVRNSVVMDSFALERSLGRNLISVADRWISYGVVNEAGAYPEVRSIYGTYLQQKRGPDAVVVYAAMPELRRATGWTDWEIDRALAVIAWEGIRANPREFLTSRLRRLPLLFGDPGPSSWYALQEQTYLPLLARTGRINPELVSRSLVAPGLENTRFELAARAYEALSIQWESLAWLVALLLGFAGIVFVERRKTAWLLAGMLAYLWMGTILLQPPNARYRIPGLPWEALFAVAGAWFAWRAVVWIVRKKLRRSWGEISDTALVGIAAGALLVILGGRVWAGSALEPILRTADFAPQETAELGGGSLQEVTVAGRRLTVLYWEGGATDRDATMVAEVPLQRGGAYAARVFYSCAEATCAGGRMELSAVDDAGRTLSQVSRPLSQERIDNDLFWDQLELRIAVPDGAQRLQGELSLRGGTGNLVIPWIAVRRENMVPF